MLNIAQPRADEQLFHGVNAIREGGSAEEMNLQSAPGGFPTPETIDFTKLHGGIPSVELDSENCIVFRMGEGAPVDKETLVAALKAELRVKRAAHDPHYLIWCEYVVKLRTFLDRDTPFEEGKG
jgi:hypothetical protein